MDSFRKIEFFSGILKNKIEKDINALNHKYTFNEKEEIALDFVTDISTAIKSINNEDELELIDIQKGSIKSIFSLDLKSIAEIAEKIKAETEKPKAEMGKLNSETKINETKAILEFFEKYQSLGIRQFQLGNKLLITVDERNNFFLSLPEKNE